MIELLMVSRIAYIICSFFYERHPMKNLIILFAILSLTGCTAHMSTTLHMQEPPRFDMIETGAYKAKHSLELSGWVSGIPNSTVARDSNITIEKVARMKNFVTDTIEITKGKIFYYPRISYGGSIGWNFTRHFGMGIQGSYAKNYDMPNMYTTYFDNTNSRLGIYLRIGGPLGESEKVSLVGNIKRSFSLYDMIFVVGDSIATDSANTSSESMRMESEYSLAFQIRPVKFVGVFVGAGLSGPHLLNRFVTEKDKESMSEILLYGGLSAYPTPSLALSPWIGIGNTTRAGVRVEFMPVLK